MALLPQSGQYQLSFRQGASPNPSLNYASISVSSTSAPIELDGFLQWQRDNNNGATATIIGGSQQGFLNSLLFSTGMRLNLQISSDINFLRYGPLSIIGLANNRIQVVHPNNNCVPSGPTPTGSPTTTPTGSPVSTPTGSPTPSPSPTPSYTNDCFRNAIIATQDPKTTNTSIAFSQGGFRSVYPSGTNGINQTIATATVKYIYPAKDAIDLTLTDAGGNAISWSRVRLPDGRIGSMDLTKPIYVSYISNPANVTPIVPTGVYEFEQYIGSDLTTIKIKCIGSTNSYSENNTVVPINGKVYNSRMVSGDLRSASSSLAILLLDVRTGQIYASQNGNDFINKTVLNENLYKDIACGGERFIIVGNKDNTMRAAITDNYGSMWQYSKIENSDLGKGIIFANVNQMFITFGNASIATSKNGVDWKVQPVVLDGQEAIITVFEYFEDIFVITNKGKSINIKTGKSSQIHQSGEFPTSTTYFLGGIYGTDGSYLYNTNDGYNWYRKEIIDLNKYGSPEAFHIGGNEKLLILSSDLPSLAPYFYYSTDGIILSPSDKIEKVSSKFYKPTMLGDAVIIPGQDQIQISKYTFFSVLNSGSSITSQQASAATNCFVGWGAVGSSYSIPIYNNDAISSSSGAIFSGDNSAGSTNYGLSVFHNTDGYQMIFLSSGKKTSVGTNGKAFQLGDTITIALSSSSINALSAGWTDINAQYKISNINSEYVISLTCTDGTIPEPVILPAVKNENKCGIEWRTTNLPANVLLGNTPVVCSNGTIVAVSNTGAVFTSFDGFNWKSSATQASGFSNSFLAVDSSQREYVLLLSKNNQILLNDKSGVGAWINRQIPLIANWSTGISAAGMSIILADGSADYIYSYDLINWQLNQIPISTWKTMAYGKGYYVAMSTSLLAARSKDGLNWTTFELPISGVNQVVFQENIFVAVGTEGILISSDAINWAKTSAPRKNYMSANVNNGRILALINNGEMQYSDDQGVTWSAITSYMSDSIIYNKVMYTSGGTQASPRLIAFALNSGAILISNCDWSVSTQSGSSVLFGGQTIGSGRKLVPIPQASPAGSLVPGQKSGISVTYPLYNGQSLSAYLSEGFTLGPFKVISSNGDNTLTATLETVDIPIESLFPNSLTTVSFVSKSGFSFLLRPALKGNIVFKVRVSDNKSGIQSEPIIINVAVKEIPSKKKKTQQTPILTSSPRATARLPHQDPAYEIVAIKSMFDLTKLFNNESASRNWPPSYDDPRIIYPGRYTFDITFTGALPDNLVNKKITIDLAYCIFPEIDNIDAYWEGLQARCREGGVNFEAFYDLVKNIKGYRDNFPDPKNPKTSQVPACKQLLDLKGQLLSKLLYRKVTGDNTITYGYNGPEGYYCDQNYLSIDQVRRGIEICIKKAFPNGSPLNYIEFEPTFDIATKRRSKTQSIIRVPGFRLNIDGQDYPNNTIGFNIQINRASQVLGFFNQNGVTGSHFCAERMIIGCNYSFSPNPLDRLSAGVFNTAQYLDTSLTPPKTINNNLDTTIETKLFTAISITGGAFDASQPVLSAKVRPNDCSPGIMGSKNMPIVELVKYLNSNCSYPSDRSIDALPTFFFSANGALGAVINTFNAARKQKFSTEFINATLTGRITLDASVDSFLTAFGLKFSNAGSGNFIPYLCPDGTSMIGAYYTSLLLSRGLSEWGYTYNQNLPKFIPSKTTIQEPNLSNFGRGTSALASGATIRTANYISFSDILLDTSKHNCEDMSFKIELPANQYRLSIVESKSRIDGHYKADFKALYQYDGNIAVKSLVPEGSFKNSGDASARYKGKYIEFVHDGGEIRIWIPVKNPKTTSGTIKLALEKADSYRSEILVIDSNKILKLRMSEARKIQNEIGDIYLVTIVKDNGDDFAIALPSLDGESIVMPKVSKYRFQKKADHLGQQDVYWPVT